MAKSGEQTRWSRREVMGVLGAGVGLGIASRWEPAGALASGRARAGRRAGHAARRHHPHDCR